MTKMTTLKKKSTSKSSNSVVEGVYSIEEFNKLKPELTDYNDLKEYITDILESIRTELSSRSVWASGNGFKPKGDDNDWRTRKNPKFMENFTSKDKEVLSINMELNKVSINNYEKVYNSMITKLNTIDDDEFEDMLKNTFTQLFIKSYSQPSVINANVKLIKLFLNNEKYNDVCSEILNEIIINYNELLISSNENIINDLSKYLRNTTEYINVGKLFNNLLTEGLYSIQDFTTGIKSTVDKSLIMIDWESDKTAIDININLIIGMLNEASTTVKKILTNNDYRNLEALIRMMINNKNINKTIKFKLMDIIEKF